eukprot:1820503-Rhodomonas_salina.1
MAQQEFADATKAHAAAFAGKCKMLESLAKSDPGMLKSKTSDGETPAHHAAAAGQGQVLVFLGNFDVALLTAVDNDGWNPAHACAFYGHLEALKVISQFAPETLLAKDTQNRMPVDLTSNSGCVTFLKALARDGFDCAMPTRVVDVVEDEPETDTDDGLPPVPAMLVEEVQREVKKVVAQFTMRVVEAVARADGFHSPVPTRVVDEFSRASAASAASTPVKQTAEPAANRALNLKPAQKEDVPMTAAVRTRASFGEPTQGSGNEHAMADVPTKPTPLPAGPFKATPQQEVSNTIKAALTPSAPSKTTPTQAVPTTEDTTPVPIQPKSSTRTKGTFVVPADTPASLTAHSTITEKSADSSAAGTPISSTANTARRRSSLCMETVQTTKGGEQS